jgi:hypothetical protein
VVSGVLAPALAHSQLGLAVGMAVLLTLGFISWFIYQSIPKTEALRAGT